MKTGFKIIGTLTAAIVLFALPVAGQVHVLGSNQLARVFAQLHEVDFETLPSTADDLPNPLRLGGLTFTDRAPTFQSGTCSSPTCQPDPQNTNGANIALALNNRATITFALPRRIVVLELQGNGSNTFEFRFTDARGHRRIVVARTVAFAPTLVAASSSAGIRKVELLRVRPGPEAGPLSLARVLFSDPVLPSRPVPNGGPMQWRVRR